MKELFRKAGAEEDIDSCIQKADVLAEEELKDITNGHDALKVLGVICKDGTSTLGEKKLRGELIDNYKKEEFTGERRKRKRERTGVNSLWQYRPIPSLWHCFGLRGLQ